MEEKDVRRMEGLKRMQHIKGVMGTKKTNGVRAVKEMNGVEVAIRSRKSTGRKGNTGKFRVSKVNKKEVKIGTEYQKEYRGEQEKRRYGKSRE